MKDKIDSPFEDNRPPLGSWNRFYAVVIGVLLAQIILYYFISSAF